MMKRGNKLFAGLLGLVTALAAMPLTTTAAATPSTSVRMGDLNGDGIVAVDDALDALILYADSLAFKADNTANSQNGVADVDMNGKVDVMDACNILHYYAQTLAGYQPLWADFRSVSYQDGSDYYGNPDDTDGRLFTLKGMYLEIGCATGAPGETVSVPVYLAGAKELAGFQYFQNTPVGLGCVDIQPALGFHGTPDPENKELNDPAFATNPDNGALIWVNTRGENLSITDGCIIGTYRYTIAEDAKSGDIIPITADVTSNMFVCVTDAGTSQIDSYQYTLVNGVVAVK